MWISVNMRTVEVDGALMDKKRSSVWIFGINHDIEDVSFSSKVV